MFTTIKNKIVALFLGSLATRSTKALSAFTKVKTNLTTINDQLLTERSKATDKIIKAEAERARIGQVISDNDRVIEKLNKFLA